MIRWIGAKRIVFVPMIRPLDINRDRDSFLQLVKRRILFDPRATGDTSFANYIHTTSSGRAWIDPVILFPIETSSEDLMFDEVTRTQAREYAAANVSGVPGVDYYVAMIGQNGRPGAGGSAEALSWVFRTHAEATIGEIFMESIHTITGLLDYYLVSPNLDGFDPMAISAGAHPTVYTKVLLGWLDSNDVVRHPGEQRDYSIRHQAISTPSASAIGRAAVKVPGATGPYYIESRHILDPFEAFIGQQGEGVIVYQVALEDDHADSDPETVRPIIYLRTSGLKEGQQYRDGDNITVTVDSFFYAGVRIRVRSPKFAAAWQCAEWGRQIVRLERSLDSELQEDNPDMEVIRSLQARISRLEDLMEAGGCNFR